MMENIPKGDKTHVQYVNYLPKNDNKMRFNTHPLDSLKQSHDYDSQINSREGNHEATEPKEDYVFENDDQNKWQPKENGPFDDWVMIERMHEDFNHSQGFPWNPVEILQKFFISLKSK